MRVDVDAAAGPLVGERLGQLRQAALRRRVGGHEDAALEGEQRAMLTILPARLRAISRRPTSRRQPERARQVDGQHEIPVLVGVLGRRRAADRAGVVDQDVDRAEGGLGVVDDRAGAAGSLRSPHDGGGAPAQRLDRPPPSSTGGTSDVQTTSAPASASARAMPAPSPAVAPVTRATSPVEPE